MNAVSKSRSPIHSIHSATFLNTHTDFSEPDSLGNFTDETTIEGLEPDSEESGAVDGAWWPRSDDLAQDCPAGCGARCAYRCRCASRGTYARTPIGHPQ